MLSFGFDRVVAKPPSDEDLDNIVRRTGEEPPDIKVSKSSLASFDENEQFVKIREWEGKTFDRPEVCAEK